MPAELSDVAARLRDERLKRKLTQAELGELAGLSEFQVNRLEKGVKRLSAGEVTALSDALRIPVADLLTPERARGGLAWAARLQDGADGEAAVKATRRLVDLVDLEDMLCRLGATRRVEPLQVQAKTTGGYLAQAQATADSVRAAAGIEPEDAIDDLEGLLERFGIDVLVDVLDVGVSGLVAVEGSRDGHGLRLAAVDSSEAWARQRFTMAHELAHVVFGDPHEDRPLIDRYRPGAKSTEESRANAFAANLIASSAALRRVKAAFESAHGSQNWPLTQRAAVKKLAVLACEQLGLSVESMAYRLLNEKLIDDAGCAWLQASNRANLFSTSGLADVWSQWELARNRVEPPRRLLSAALEAYSRGEVGVSQVAKLYGRDDTELLRKELAVAGWEPAWA